MLERDLRPRILLVGDVMFDRYVWGDVERISPEAPIPILRIGGKSTAWAGRAASPRCSRRSGRQTILAAVVGDDAEGRIVRELLDKLGVDSGGADRRRPPHHGQGAAAGAGSSAIRTR